MAVQTTPAQASDYVFAQPSPNIVKQDGCNYWIPVQANRSATLVNCAWPEHREVFTIPESVAGAPVKAIDLYVFNDPNRSNFWGPQTRVTGIVVPASVTQLHERTFYGLGDWSWVRFLGSSMPSGDCCFTARPSGVVSFYRKQGGTWPATLDGQPLVTVAPPTFTTQPANTNLFDGNGLTLTAAANAHVGGGELSYQWFKDGIAIRNATAPTLSIPRMDTLDSGTYRLLAKNWAGETWSSPAVVTVTQRPRVVRSGVVYEDRGTHFAAVGTQLPYPAGEFTIAGEIEHRPVTEIGPGAFKGKGALARGTLNLPDSVTKIGESAFQNTALTDVTFGSGLTTIDSYAFENVSTLAAARFKGAAPTTMGTNAFANSGTARFYRNGSTGAWPARIDAHDVVAVSTPKLATQPVGTGVVIGQPVTLSAAVNPQLGEGGVFYEWFKNGVSVAYTASPELSITAAAVEDSGSYHLRATNWAGDTDSDAVEVTVRPDDVHFLHYGVWYADDSEGMVAQGCDSSFTGKLVIADAVKGVPVTAIGNEAFLNLRSTVTSLDLGKTVKTIGSDAFSRATGLTGNLSIPDSVTTIGTGAFYGTGLTAVTFGTGVQNIENGAFYGLNLAQVRFLGSGDAPSIATNSFTNTGSDPFYRKASAEGTWPTHIGAHELKPVEAPAFTAQPVGSSVKTGETVTLTAAVDAQPGGGEVDYQWFKGETAIPGAQSPELSIPGAKLDDSGTYRLRATTWAGETFSDQVEVSVAERPSLLLPSSPSVTAIRGVCLARDLSHRELPTLPTSAATHSTIPVCRSCCGCLPRALGRTMSRGFRSQRSRRLASPPCRWMPPQPLVSR